MRTSIFFKLLSICVAFCFANTVLLAQYRDHGVLFKKLDLPESGFVEKLAQLRKYAYATEFIFIEANDFLPAMRSGQLKFVLPGQLDSTTAQTSSLKIKTPQEYTWTGDILASEGQGLLGEVTVYYNKGRMSCSITYKDQAYQIQPLSEFTKAHVLYRLDKRYKEGLNCVTNQAAKQVAPSQDKGARRDPCTGGNIRVFIYFTDLAQDAGLDVNTTVNNCIAEWNSAISVSGVSSPQMEIAGSALLSGIAEGTTSTDALTQFRNSATAQNQRINSGADIMMLLCRGENWTDARGQVGAVGPEYNNAYGVIRIADAANANHTFTHEASHLFGCRHQVASDNTPGIAHGIALYNVVGQTNNQITVMHTNPTGSYNRLNRLSNPNVNVNGFKTGGNDANNAQVVTNNAGTVRNFRPPVNQPITAYVNGPYSGGIYCGVYTWEAVFSCGNENTPVTFAWSMSTDGVNFGNVLGTNETFSSHLYAQHTWIRVQVTNNGQVTSSYQQVYGNTCGGRQGTGALANLGIEADTDLMLLDAAPNPVDTHTQISFYLKRAQQASLTITDLTGRPIQILANKQFETGINSLQIAKGSIPSGIYLLNLGTSTNTKTKRIVFQ